MCQADQNASAIARPIPPTSAATASSLVVDRIAVGCADDDRKSCETIRRGVGERFDEGQTRDLVRQVMDHFGRLDVVVSNAAAYATGDLVDLPSERWEAIRTTNIDGFVHLVRYAVPELVKVGGNLVAVGSVSGMRGDWGQAAYNAS